MSKKINAVRERDVRSSEKYGQGQRKPRAYYMTAFQSTLAHARVFCFLKGVLPNEEVCTPYCPAGGCAV
ncbi:MAG: hypothetical protein J6Q16_00875, partial [Clostridia bacterium]|nr:hypothetical protein [Clostridia bacterium]